MTSVRSAFSLVALTFGASLGCGARFDPAHFEGSREPRRSEPEALREQATPSADLQMLGSVHASCVLKPGFRRLDREALSDLDCSTQRLNFALRESAASAGGEALVGARCRTRALRANPPEYGLSCEAQVARFVTAEGASSRPLSAPRSLPPSVPAPSASDVRRIDEPDASLAFRIFVDFHPRVAPFARRSRAAAEVNERALMPLSDHSLGDLSASCEDDCDERALRFGVLVAAGRLGAEDVVAVRCFNVGASHPCTGTLAAPEREE